jgi:prepilin-type N-terminal cleavage/methylation domain-containing protein
MSSYPNKLTRPRSKCGVEAFTLLEMSIVIAIISVIIAGGAVTFTAAVTQHQAEETQQKLTTLQAALLDYWRTFQRLPCPGDMSLYNPTDTNYGREGLTPGTCLGPPTASYVYNLNLLNTTRCDYSVANLSRCIYGGMVPTKSLKLPDDYAVDGWGRRILYVVDSDFTLSGASTTLSDITADATNGTQRIEVRSVSDHPKTTAGAYVLLSYGVNGHGAYGRSSGGGRISSGSNNTMELKNCHCDNLAADGTFDWLFYQSSYATTVTSSTNTFDDILVFGTRGNLNSAKE